MKLLLSQCKAEHRNTKHNTTTWSQSKTQCTLFTLLLRLLQEKWNHCWEPIWCTTWPKVCASRPSYFWPSIVYSSVWRVSQKRYLRQSWLQEMWEFVVELPCPYWRGSCWESADGESWQNLKMSRSLKVKRWSEWDFKDKAFSTINTTKNNNKKVHTALICCSFIHSSAVGILSHWRQNVLNNK